MSGIRLPRGNAFSADEGARRDRRSKDGGGSGDDWRTWMGVCAALSLVSGVLGWKIGSAEPDTPEPKGTAASARLDPTAGAWSAVVTTVPFGAANEPAGAAVAPASAPSLPYTVLRGYNDQNQPIVLIEREGQRLVASGVAVYGDYLVQLERDQVIFTYLPSAVRQAVSLPAVAQSRNLPGAGPATFWSAYRNPPAAAQKARLTESSADEESERD